MGLQQWYVACSSRHILYSLLYSGCYSILRRIPTDITPYLYRLVLRGDRPRCIAKDNQLSESDDGAGKYTGTEGSRI